MEMSTRVQEPGRPGMLRIGRLILRGGGPLYELPVIDLSLNKTSIVFPRGTPLAPGDVFRIVRPLKPGLEFRADPAIPRKVVALVKVTGVEDGTRAVVHVLRGSVRRGFWAERVDEARLAGLLYFL
jgi:hypothetical protein